MKRCPRCLLFLAMGILFPVVAVGGAEEIDGPWLRLETGGHFSTVKEIVYSPDGSKLYSVGDDKMVNVWDAATGELLLVFRVPVDGFYGGKLWALDVSPDGQWVAAGGVSIGKTRDAVYLMEANSGWIADAKRGGYPRYATASLAFSPDAKTLLSGHYDIMEWSVGEDGTLTEVARIKGHTSMVQDLEWFPDGRRFASAQARAKGFRIWEREGDRWRTVVETDDHRESVHSLSISPDGRHVVTGSWDETLRLYDAEGNFIREIGDMDTRIWRVDFSPDGRHIAASTGFDAEAFGVWIYPRAGGEPRKFLGHDQTVRDVRWNPSGNGEIAASGGSRNDILIFNADSLEVEHSLHSSGNVIVSLATEGDRVYWGHRKTGEVPNDWGPATLAFDAAKVEFVGEIDERPPGAVVELNGLRLTSDSAEGRDVTLHWPDGQSRRYDYPFPQDWITSYSFIDEKTFAIGTGYGHVHLHSAVSGDRIQTLDGHEAMVWAMAPLDGGRLLVTGSQDETLLFWNPKTGERLLNFYCDESGEWIAWTPHGYYKASPGGSRFIGWQINVDPDSTPEFYSAELFEDFLHRPDIVDRVLAAGSVDRAIAEVMNETEEKRVSRNVADRPTAQFAAILPPDVSLTAEKDETGGEDETPELGEKAIARRIAAARMNAAAARTVHESEIALIVDVEEGRSGQAVEQVWLEIDGKPASVDLAARSGRQQIDLKLHPGRNVIVARARNATARSIPRRLELDYRPVTAALDSPDSRRAGP